MRILVPALAVTLLAGCVSPSAPPPPPPPSPVASAPPPSPPPPPVAVDWRDWTTTPGDWTYRATNGGSIASYGRGGVAMSLMCDHARGTVAMALPGVTANSVAIRTTSMTRSVAATPAAGGAMVSFAASDPLLDAMGFSRGRFVVEGGGARLVLPAWAEVLRVTEDCRR